ncbi:hypothetical protein FQN54_003151 [Arachnomyces sp. PD_36]|nr:hypothetical protein FQN54_003151 [Arachnomyces sp. PD_36]
MLSKLEAASSLLLGLALVPQAAAHGHVSGITIDGTFYSGWLDSFPHVPNPPDVIAWSTTVTDNGFVSPSQFGSADIICHRGGAPGPISAPVAAGGTIELQWNTWPDSHHGPVIDYIARVDGDFSNINKGSLQWVKIDEGGLRSGSNPGRWATDELIADDFTWVTKIPASLAPGNYVLRHEIIALHSAGQSNGAQAYPQCINLRVTGSGSKTPSGGEPATSFYTAQDPGILFNLYTQFSQYSIPGPPVWSP